MSISIPPELLVVLLTILCIGVPMVISISPWQTDRELERAAADARRKEWKRQHECKFPSAEKTIRRARKRTFRTWACGECNDTWRPIFNGEPPFAYSKEYSANVTLAWEKVDIDVENEDED